MTNLALTVYLLIFHVIQEQDISGVQQKVASLKVKHGPCESSVEPVLQKHGIQRQAYHGGAFVGNHIHKALQKSVIAEITSAPVREIETHCPNEMVLEQEAKIIERRHNDLMSQYAACSAIFSSSAPVSNEIENSLDGHIKTFMASARREVVSRAPGNITPKLHLLEDHLLPCIRRFGVGLGLLGEQGGESIHHQLNVLNTTFNSIRNNIDRLKTVVTHHCIATLPQHGPHVPPVKRSKV